MTARTVKMEAGELAWICEQLSLVQKSGVPLADGVSMLAEGDYLPRQTDVLRMLSQRLQAGMNLADAMTSLGGFPDYLLRMVQIGEMSGRLDQVLSGLAGFYLQEDQQRRRIRNALIYPVVLLILMLIIIVFLVVRVLPLFDQILTSFGGTMPPFSRGLLGMSAFLSRYAVWIILLLGLITAGIWLFFARTEKGQRLRDQLRLTMPLFGSLNRKVYASRFAAALATLLGSGIDMNASLEMTGQVIGNQIVADQIEHCRQRMEKGENLFAVLREMRLFPPLFARMLELASKTGDLDTVMERIGRNYAGEIESRLARMTGLVEPILIVILALIIGLILLSVLLPLAQILSSIG